MKDIEKRAYEKASLLKASNGANRQRHGEKNKRIKRNKLKFIDQC